MDSADVRTTLFPVVALAVGLAIPVQASAAEDSGKVCIMRVSDPATLVAIEVSENGTMVAKVKVHQYFCVEHRPGTYEYTAKLWTNKEPGPPVPAVLKAAETLYYRAEYVVRTELGTPYFLLGAIDENTYRGLLPAVKPVSAANLFFVPSP